MLVLRHTCNVEEHLFKQISKLKHFIIQYNKIVYYTCVVATAGIMDSWGQVSFENYSIFLLSVYQYWIGMYSYASPKMSTI